MTQCADVLIIGAGMAGCALAYELGERGVSTLLLERREAGKGATWAAGGMLSPLGEISEPGALMQLAMRGLHHYDALFQELEARLRRKLQRYDAGMLHLCYSEEEARNAQDKLAWQKQLALDVEWLERRALLQLEPRFVKSVVGAVRSSEWGVEPAEVLGALVDASASCVQLREQAEVTGWRLQSPHRVHEVEVRGERISCGQIVIAAGAWSGELARTLGVSLPIQPVRGQMLALAPGKPVCPFIVWGKSYLIPRNNGEWLAGATMEHSGLSEETNAEGRLEILQRAGQTMEGLEDAKITRHWCGLRPASSDGKPILGRLPGFDNVWIASGYFRNGILLGPISGKLLAESIVADALAPELKPFTLDRFGSELTRSLEC